VPGRILVQGMGPPSPVLLPWSSDTEGGEKRRRDGPAVGAGCALHGGQSKGDRRCARSGSRWRRTSPEPTKIWRKPVAAARVVRRGREAGLDEGKERKEEIWSGACLLAPWTKRGPARGPSCPVPGDAWRAATAVLSTVVRKKMRCEKMVLPLAGMQNHQGSHRALLFGSVTTANHVHSVADIWVPRKAGPQISDCAGTSRRAMGG
jgi:hypothetical protein